MESLVHKTSVGLCHLYYSEAIVIGTPVVIKLLVCRLNAVGFSGPGGPMLSCESEIVFTCGSLPLSLCCWMLLGMLWA